MWWLVSVVLYLVPVIALVVATLRRDEPLWQVALRIPTAVALDLIVVLSMSRLMRLETAALASRPLAIALAAAWLWWRRKRGDAWGIPTELRARAVLAALASAAAACALSLTLSRKYHIWDRYWHINLVSSLRGQRLPFANVYDPHGPLSYHYSGDALAAMFQSFSFASLHSSYALSLAHDVVFALSGATLGLLFVAWGARGASTATLATVCWVLAGPTALLRDDGRQWAGYSVLNYLTLSFRPHASLAGLFSIGFVCALIARVAEARDRGPTRAPPLATAVTLIATSAGLAITDEASCGLFGLAVGVAWLLWPEIVGLSRKPSLLAMAGLLAAVVVANLMFAGLFSPGAERPSMKLVPWRAPGFENPTLSFADPNGAKMFVVDVAGPLVFGLIALWSFAKKRTRAEAALSALLLVLVAAGVFGLGRVDIPPRPVEAHRFMTAPMLAGPLVLSYWLFGSDHDAPTPPVLALSLLALALPALSTFAWLRSPGGTNLQRGDSFFTKEDFYRTECRSEVGARLGEQPRPTYLATDVFFVYTGCHPVFTSGRSGGHRIKTSRPLQGWEAFVDLDKEVLAPGQPLDVICPARGTKDVVCLRAMQRPCAPVATTQLGTEIVRCTLDAPERAALIKSGGK